MKASDPNAAQTKRVPAESPKQTPTRETLAVEDLLTDTGTQIRSEISEYIVAEYVEALDDGARFPPVVIFRSSNGDILADGFRREIQRRQARPTTSRMLAHGWYSTQQVHGHHL